ncbi:MAG TPA: heme-binding protein [Steroidobacteraceae bacterium]|nr:heme-binding protein [Steroidobacteraceae bacterium]
MPGAEAGVAVPDASAPLLAQDVARRMAMRCLERSKSNGWPPFSIAIVDSSGALILFHREDGAVAVTADAAILKARTSARAGISSRDMGAMSRDQPTRDLFILLQLTDDPGGVPVLRSGRVVGAVGVSGGSAEQDTGCAKFMVDAFGKN